ncbi:MAG: cobaltochelatase CobT-related protein, partial [Pseudomonadales bacterium]
MDHLIHLFEEHLASRLLALGVLFCAELLAIGIRHDVTNYYRRAVMITDAGLLRL